jgi:hypothetical protein
MVFLSLDRKVRARILVLHATVMAGPWPCKFGQRSPQIRARDADIFWGESTDANLLLGRLLPDYFPKIFGPKENESLDVEASRKEFDALVKVINEQTSGDKSADEIAWGYAQFPLSTACIQSL